MVHAGKGWGGGRSFFGSTGTSGLLVVVVVMNGVGLDGAATNGFRPPSLLHVQIGLRNLAVALPRELTKAGLLLVSKYCCVAINELEFGRK